MKNQTGNRLSEDQARNYICEIILAIEHLHQNNILYRDLKPENVLVTNDGHIKLTDFGLSKVLREDFYNQTDFVGTHAYLAPEMLSNRPHGRSIDWYGVGAILYEFLVRVPPYYTPEAEKLYENILKAPLIMPSHISPICADLI